MRTYLLLACLLLAAGKVAAHPMPNTIVNLSVLDDRMQGEAKMPLIDLETAFGKKIEDINSPALQNYFAQHITAISGRRRWYTKIGAISIHEDTDPFVGNFQELSVTFELVPLITNDLRTFTFDYTAIIHQVVTHKILVFLEEDWRNGIHREPETVPLGVIQMDVRTEKASPLLVTRDEGSFWKGFFGMFNLGVKHIQTGLDHILFLLMLLLIAPLTMEENKWSGYQGFRYTLNRFFKISIAFTIGHSLTLLMGSFNVFSFQPQYIEVLIAISILASAINCIIPIFRRREVMVAGFFGLIHGLAFSFSLSKLNLGLGGKLISVLGFNVGIEAMQLVIMIIFFPVLLMGKLKLYPSLRIAFAVITMILAMAWVMERVSNQGNIITVYINRLL